MFLRLAHLAGAVAIASASFFLSSCTSNTTTTSPAATVLPARAGITPLPYDEARDIIATLADAAPATLRSTPFTPDGWLTWLSEHDRSVRARVDLGNEDSVYYFWLYGTSFSSRPRATQTTLASLSSNEAIDLLEGRMNDLLVALGKPEDDSRLLFARSVFERRNLDPSSGTGREAARAFLLETRSRILAENRQLSRTLMSASTLPDTGAQDAVFGTMLRDRGLSSDTSLVANFAVFGALRSLASRSAVEPRSFSRVAVIGPGLDFTDKADGYDFYPEQSMQPFAVIDALRELNLAAETGLELVALDLNPRITEHFENARSVANEGRDYVLHMPFDRRAYPAPRPELVRYWQSAGNRIGNVAPPAPLPAGTTDIDLRAVAVQPDVVRSIRPRDLNIVTERLRDAEAFDLIVATNVLVYYDRFEQALALANIAAMLKPGGLFLTNSPVAPPPNLRPRADVSGPIAVARDEADAMLWFEKPRR